MKGCPFPIPIPLPLHIPIPIPVPHPFCIPVSVPISIPPAFQSPTHPHSIQFPSLLSPSSPPILYQSYSHPLSIPSPLPVFLRTADVRAALSHMYSHPSSAPCTTAGRVDEIRRSPLKRIASVCSTHMMRSFNCFVYHLNADFIFTVFAPLQGFWCELKHENRVL